VDRVHVDDQVADHGHVAHRLDRDQGVLLALLGRVPPRAVPAPRRLLEVGVAGKARLAVHADAARAADGLLAGAADPDRAVLVVLDLEDRVEHRLNRGEIDRVLVPVTLCTRLRLAAADSQRVLGHLQYVLSSGCQRVIVTGE
jgi:hypothetical protein